MGVSILVFLEALLQPQNISRFFVIPFCFNPCFPGSSTSTRNCKRKNHNTKKFQSLFSWKLYFNLCDQGRWPDGLDVSILVFLEALLQPRREPKAKTLSLGFNPCFPGSSTSTTTSPKIEAPGVCFNPCFPGSSTSTLTLCSLSFISFQSFNPCFPGSSTSTSYQFLEHFKSSEFQSLFSWKLYFNLHF